MKNSPLDKPNPIVMTEAEMSRIAHKVIERINRAGTLGKAPLSSESLRPRHKRGG